MASQLARNYLADAAAQVTAESQWAIPLFSGHVDPPGQAVAMDQLHFDEEPDDPPACEILELRPSRSRPDRGITTIRSETRNQRGEVVQVLVAKLVVPRSKASTNSDAAQCHSTQEPVLVVTSWMIRLPESLRSALDVSREARKTARGEHLSVEHFEAAR